MYLGVSQNVSYMLCYIPREYMYLDILHVFHTYPKRVQDTFWDTYQIHQDICILHVGYMRDRYMGICRGSSGYIEDTLRIHAGYMTHEIHEIQLRYNVSQLYPERYVSANVSCCILMYLDIYERDTSRYVHDTCTIHARYMHDTWDRTYPDNTPPQIR